MRTILFRGKSLLTGEWLHGNLIIDSEVGAGIFNNGVIQAVDAETVGQYTGLADKNGIGVFEGDIVRCSRGCPHNVVWLNEYAGTYVGGMPAWYLSGIKEGYAWTGAEEIAGTVHDDPET